MTAGGAGKRGARAASEGAKTWFIPDGYLAMPPQVSGEYFSHEAVCVLNTGKKDAHLCIDFYFEDREPASTSPITVPAERIFHIRLDKPEHLNGLVLPRDVPYAMRVRADAPVIVQLIVEHFRTDGRQSDSTLMTTMAHPLAE